MGKRWVFVLGSREIIRITNCLNKLPKVNWDRISQKQGHVYAFGWIDRDKDSYKDFFLIDFARGKPVDYCSSDSVYNLEYGKILGNLYSQQCKRIEEYFKDVKNKIKIKNKRNAG